MKLSRRTLLKLGLGAGALLAVPVGMQAHWSSKDFTRSDYSPTAPKAPAGRRSWRNWSGRYTATPQEIYSAPSEGELAEKIANWEGRIRPVGSGHSFIDIVPTEDLMIDVGQLSGLYDVDKENKTVTFGAGTRLRQAARLAAEQGLGFSNLPDVDVQTLAGSFSTGTHGTGRTLHALHNTVKNFRLIRPDGEVLNVSRDENPELFDAGRVSLGSLGVISQYTLQLVDTYALNRKIYFLKTEDVLDQFIELSKAHRNFEFFILPNTGYSALLTHDLYEGELEGRPPSQDEDFILTLKQLRDVLGWSPWLRRSAFKAYVNTLIPESGLAEDTTDEYWKLLSSSRITKMNEMEYHIPEANAQKAVREVAAVMDSSKESFYPIEVRFTGQDDAWLSPFNDGVRCSIAVHTLHSESYMPLYDAVEPIVRKYGGRPHWGKFHSLDVQHLDELYPNFAQFRELRRDMDPTGKFLNTRLASIFGEDFGASSTS
ncbi:L-gulono-1,4-lactone dehydrogenase [Pseudovibrio axinellae]|uniref:L-gulono-1,4-lactone dehydrogenase n=1 Tax=Pseudovibrio axinellae TaxID=989403 RepID=A0A165ZG15_9HYPH|nr:D-arabinono-1,4-lactone oxidase [Pseudovibrio axinellae]KZL19856.1 L-gulono-1,4-lactone dehydrogenase [Pseudovibrio axinellae]SER39052.1 FAD-linked oxidoreductase [Pseudovibrio axinellae]